MIAIIDYEAGNIRSLRNGLERVGASAELTADPETIRQADKVIFPGVGEASSAMSRLRKLGLDDLIPSLTQPVLGICLGLQLMCRWSEENDTSGLGIFPVEVKLFRGELKVPQVGWNTIEQLKGPLFQDIPAGSDCYFVHGYHAGIGAGTTATSHYGQEFSAAYSQDNFHAVQFHPEISSTTGEQVLRNFLNL